jgi:hypothetical protein
MSRLRKFVPHEADEAAETITGGPVYEPEASETFENAKVVTVGLRSPADGTGNAPHASNVMDWDALLTFNGKADPDCLMGRRYLGRTDGCIIVAPSGVGKSVMALQLAACAALGRHFFGMQIHKPLRVLYVQAEDSFGDVAEAVQGFVYGFKPNSEDLVALKHRLRIVRWNDCSGATFLAKLRAESDLWKFDLVIINPLFSFAGCNLSEQKEVSPFLRNGLNPILSETRAAAILIHHTNKPSQDKGRKEGATTDDDLRYVGSGSSELTNWARSYITLQCARSAHPPVYKLAFVKRGNRTGIADEDGHPLTKIYVEHSTDGLCWLPSDWRPEQGDSGQFKKRFDLDAARKVYDPNLSWAQNEDAIATIQGLSPRAVRRYRKDLDTAFIE